MTHTESHTVSIESKYMAFGARLRERRESLGIDHKEAAAQLYLHDNVILMLESGQFKHDLPLLFIRGYLRNYCKFLNIPQQEVTTVLALLQPSASPADEAPEKPVMRKPIPTNTSTSFINLKSVLATTVVVLVIAIISGISVWWFGENHTLHLPHITQAHTLPELLPSRPSVQAQPTTAGITHLVKPNASHTSLYPEQPWLEWLSSLIAFLLVVKFGMRNPSYAKAYANTSSGTSSKPSLLLTSTKAPMPFYGMVCALKEHRTTFFFTFIFLSSIIGVAVNWQHKQSKHTMPSIAASSPSKAPNIVFEPKPFDPNFTPMILPSPAFMATLEKQFMVNDLQKMINEIEQYRNQASSTYLSLTDPTTELGELGEKYPTKKYKSRRSKPAYLNYT